MKTKTNYSYNPKTAFGNTILIQAIEAEKELQERKSAIKDCAACDEYGKRETECDQCDGYGTLEITCEHN